MLENTSIEKWAEVFVELKMEFCRKNQMGFIFSTRFGADFFIECKNWILRNDFLIPENGEKLGDYDKNFNSWLKIVRMEKS